MVEVNEVRSAAKKALAAAKSARMELELHDVVFLGAQGRAEPGLLFGNYANMISNRIITLYDDCSLLLERDRISSACVLSRCILETFAVANFAEHEVGKALNRHGIDRAGETVLDYINSSRLKVEEQKRFASGEFSADDHHFTEEAVTRMENGAGLSKHILNALRHLFKTEMAATGASNSQFELFYEALSEWSHPSQTSLFHAFTQETWEIETSVGVVSLWDGALAACGKAMHIVTAIPELREGMLDVAGQLTSASQK